MSYFEFSFIAVGMLIEKYNKESCKDSRPTTVTVAETQPKPR